MNIKQTSKRNSQTPLRWLVLAWCLILWGKFLPALQVEQTMPAGSSARAAQQQQSAQTPDYKLGDFHDSSLAEYQKRLRALNEDRQKSMVADTNKLLRLVNELNEEIAQNSPNALTPDEIHKLSEIEKLARHVKDKMKLTPNPE